MPKTSVRDAGNLNQQAQHDREAAASSYACADLIWTNPERVSGTSCFAGTRVQIKHLWDYLEEGEPLSEFLEGFPGVTPEQAIGVLDIAFRRLIADLPSE